MIFRINTVVLRIIVVKVDFHTNCSILGCCNFATLWTSGMEFRHRTTNTLSFIITKLECFLQHRLIIVGLMNQISAVFWVLKLFFTHHFNNSHPSYDCANKSFFTKFLLHKKLQKKKYYYFERFHRVLYFLTGNLKLYDICSSLPKFHADCSMEW